MTSPTISVLMPVYNGLPYLPAAVDSILKQSYSNYEFLIFDDGSQDGSQQYLSSIDDPRVKLTVLEHQGLGPLLNFGLQKAQGEFIARMDADDIAHPRRFERQIQTMANHPECVACGSNIQLMDSESQLGDIRQMPASNIKIFQDLIFGKTSICHPTSMFRKKSAHEIGGYNASLVPAEDYDFWWRMSAKGSLLNIQSPLLNYRQHPSSVSSTQTDTQRTLVQALLAKAMVNEKLALSRENAEAFASVVLAKAVPTDIYEEQFKGFMKVARRLLARMVNDNEHQMAHDTHQRFRGRIMKLEEAIGFKDSENWRRYLRYCNIRPTNQSLISFALGHAYYRYRFPQQSSA